MRKFEGTKKVLSVLLALSMVLSYLPMSTLAAEDGTCPHHTHDDKCGYVAAVEGQPCNHQCTESCTTKDVTQCVHDHAAEGCTHTDAVEAVVCDHQHDDNCNYVPAQEEVKCTCEPQMVHAAECASLLTEGAECDCTPTLTHAEGCEPRAAVAESCNHQHGECAYKEAVKESWSCGHVCTKETGCVKAVCAHEHDTNCGFVKKVKGSDCTYVCEACKNEEEKVCSCDTDDSTHATFCGLYVRPENPTCSCAMPCTEENVNQWCHVCGLEGAVSCTGRDKAVGYATSGTTGACSWSLDENGVLTISGTGAIANNAFVDNNNIKLVVIEEGVTSIGNYAFASCSSLTSVTIPGSVTTISNYAFYYCSSLTTVEYLGTEEPTAGSNVFYSASIITVKVPAGYDGETFCGIRVEPSTPTTYTVSFAANGGTGTMADVTGVSGEYTLPECTFTAPEGKRFKAWSVGGVEKNAGDKITVSANTTLTAVWEVIYTVSVQHAAYGTVVADKTTAAAGETVTLTVTPSSNLYFLDTLSYCEYYDSSNNTNIVPNGDVYSFIMPAAHVMVNATFKQGESYSIWVQGWLVNSANKDDILGDGTVSYDPDTKTLTLNNAIIQYENGNGISFDGDTIIIAGTGSIIGSTIGIYARNGSVTVTGSFNEITGVSKGISAKGDVVISGSVDNISGGANGIHSHNGNISITGTINEVDATNTGSSLRVENNNTITIGENAEVKSKDAIVGTVVNGGILRLPEDQSKDNCSGGTLYIGEKGYVWSTADNAYRCLNDDHRFESDSTDCLDCGMPKVPVTGITISPPDTLYVGQTTELTAIISPTNATNQAVAWTSSDPAVLKIVNSANNPATVNALAPGDATITVKAQDGTDVSATCTVTVSYLPAPENPCTISGAAYVTNGVYWFKKGVSATVNAPAGYTISTSQGGTYGISVTISGPTSVYLKEENRGALTDAISLDNMLKWDTTAPTGTIALVNIDEKWNAWTDSPVTVYTQKNGITVTANDAESGVKAIEYSVQSAPVSDWTAINDWEGYNGTFTLTENARSVVYVKLTDNVGNESCLSTNIIYVDTTAPVISGITDGATYYTTQKATATDNAALDTLTGTNSNGTISGNPEQETEHTIVATDKAGNTTTFEITMKPISSLATGLPAEDTVKLTDKETIETIKENVSDVLTNQSANATEEEKDKLEAIIAECNDLLNQIKKAEDVIALIQALPDASKVEPDNKTAIDAYDAALAAYNDPNLPASSKRMVGEENKAKLDAVGKALVAYDIIHQSSKYYVKGSGKTLTFTANGYYADYGSYAENAYGKFVSIEVDGKVVDAKNYTAKAGSTVITLKSSFLESLSTGKHTIKVNYIDGSTDGNDTFRISVNNGNPFTGDNSHMMLFGGVALTSLLCMAMMIVFFPRKKGKYQR